MRRNDKSMPGTGKSSRCHGRQKCRPAMRWPCRKRRSPPRRYDVRTGQAGGYCGRPRRKHRRASPFQSPPPPRSPMMAPVEGLLFQEKPAARGLESLPADAVDGMAGGRIIRGADESSWARRGRAPAAMGRPDPGIRTRMVLLAIPRTRSPGLAGAATDLAGSRPAIRRRLDSGSRVPCAGIGGR